MPKGKAPSLLSLNNGSISFVILVRLLSCYRCKKALPRGSRCGELKTKSNGFTKNKKICMDCASNIIAVTQSDLDKIKASLT